MRDNPYDPPKTGAAPSRGGAAGGCEGRRWVWRKRPVGWSLWLGVFIAILLALVLFTK